MSLRDSAAGPGESRDEAEGDRGGERALRGGDA